MKGAKRYASGVHTELAPLVRSIIATIARSAEGEKRRFEEAVPLDLFVPFERADLAEVRVPLLLMTSRQDHVVEPVNSDVVFDGVSSPDKRRLWLEDSYHVATIDNDAPTIYAESLAFLEARTGGRT